MTDLYSSSPQRFPTPSLRVAASAGIDEAARTVVLAYRTDSPPSVLERAIRSARQEEAALRTVVFETDGTAVPSAHALSETQVLVGALAESGLEFEVQRADTDVASQILDLAADWNAELIVMSMRRRSPVMKLLLGSSAQRVILEAECPVVVVK
ncbi:nucleotide-binding universal stress UspA family protein [Brevibacterium sanguinis]|uniref:Nucleotide-binding universal stress UspA family protein n=2 Tax=Brevibacterium TaxID=1696 RepID=A0A366IH94_9MICO|nr:MULTISPECIES: universal stress protein [Brevibacterium]RBP64928.1 nucleotide-binding universal stress UspA family protein [Brevibacterium sanguinis]RBP71191.1 nucleotide-binding universal stress UspA family protein [Brevibacterium celere]